MTLRHIQIFLAVYEEMSITKAANKIHIAQPSVSLAIKELEEYYHLKFFERINRQIFVTHSGEEFYNYASHISELLKELDYHMFSNQAFECIHLGSSITIGSYIVPNLIDNLHKIYPEQEVKVKVQNSQQIIQGILKNQLDIGLIEDNIINDQLISIPFMEYMLCFVCSSKHPILNSPSFSLNDICKYPFYLRESGSASRKFSDIYFKENQIKPTISWESVSNNAIISALKLGNGISILPHKIIEKELFNNSLSVINFHPDKFLKTFNIVYHKNKYKTPALKRLISLVENHMPYL